MKRLITFIILLTITSGAAFAANCIPSNKGLYVSGKLGPTIFEFVSYRYDKVDHNWHAGVFASGAFGYKFKNNFRFEAEGTYRHLDAKSEYVDEFDHFHLHPKLDEWTVAANFYYDFDWGCRLYPYIGIGVGAQFISGTVSARLTDGSKFKAMSRGYETGEFCQAMAGVKYKLCDQTDLSAEYRIVNNEHNHVVSLGLTRYF